MNNRYSDDALMDITVISDSTNATSPSKKSNGSMEYVLNGCSDFNKIEDLTSSCPCISPTHKDLELHEKEFELVELDKLHDYQVNCTTPLLI